MTQNLNNSLTFIAEIFIYTALIVLYLRVVRSSSEELRKSLRKEKGVSRRRDESSDNRRALQIYIQVVSVAITHSCTSLTYVLANYYDTGTVGLCVASIGYVSSQALPPIVYLYANVSIRNNFPLRISMAKARVSSHAPSQTLAVRATTQPVCLSVGGGGGGGGGGVA